MALRFNYGHIALPERPKLRDATADDSTWDTGSTAAVTSVFARAQAQPDDPILGMRDAFLADPAKEKMNLAVGVYRTAEGKPLVLDCVQAAEAELLEKQRAGATFKEYLPADGMEAFCTASIKLLLGETVSSALAEGRVVSAQSLSGTGGLHLAARMLKQLMPDATIHLPNPTWPIHHAIFEEAGVRVQYYPYYDADTCGFAFDKMTNYLRALAPGAVVLLHACAHNPTGVDPTAAQWRSLAAIVEERQLVPLVDAAYQGLASGDLDADAYGTRLLSAIPKVEMFTVQSYSKNLGLYAERAGVVTMVCNDVDVASRVRQTLKKTIRVTYSSPAQHGAAIAANVLNDTDRCAAWKQEVGGMAARLLEMRSALAKALADSDCPPPTGTTLTSWKHVLEQRGMFTYTGLQPGQVRRLREVHHVYMPADGRLCMAGLTHATCAPLAAAIKEVLTAPDEEDEGEGAAAAESSSEADSPRAEPPPAAKRARRTGHVATSSPFNPARA